MKELFEYKTKLITINDSNYPEKLKNIENPPKQLFYKGNIELLKSNKILGIVGCRDCSQYGKYVANTISNQLTKQGFIIISGCARGIDSFSHIGTIKIKKPTIAILGNGLDFIYPPENKFLEEAILNYNGLLISEYPDNAKPNKKTFPERNRIISGLSDGLIIVEAKERSGALITAEFALEQGKNIYAVPGNITSKTSVGTNRLIYDGAKILTNIDDVLEDFE